MNPINLKRREVLGAVALTLASPHAGTLAATDYPSRRIRIISPFPAGGIVDQAARIVNEFFAAELGQPVIVEALPGAGSAIGTQAVARSEPDGYTCVLAGISHVSAPLLQPTQYHPINDFAAAGLLCYGRTVAVVPADSPVRTLKDLVELAKSKPGALNYLNPGNGTVAHLSTELLKMQAGISMQSVAYKGLPPGMQDLVAGRLDFGAISLPLPLPLIKAGRLRAIGIMTAAREPELPDVMTYTEQGFANAQVLTWYIFAFPAATPKPVLARFNAVINKALADSGIRSRLSAANLSPTPPSTPEQAQALMRDDYARIARLIKDANIQPGT
ncbi:MAG: Bug family tripartite tricarboxylate transporter substrate binding protein [Burkholderiaceae bacterium]